jgi:signal transduction histidine kinase
MMHSLRAKLAASHILPIFLLMPALGLYLLYSLEDFFTQALLQQLTQQAQLLQERAMENPELLDTPESARAFAAKIGQLTDARVVLLSKDEMILASTRAEDADRIGTHYTDESVAQALRGELAQGVGHGFATQVAFVALPLRRGGNIEGVLRLSYEVNDVRSEFDQLRWLILVGVALTALIGLALGLGLATTITRPLRRLSEGAQGIARGDYRARVAIHSRDEVGALAHSFNQMALQLDEAEQTRERQLAAIVHELARPLAGMKAAIETLRDGTDADSEIRDTLLAGVDGELDRLDRLIGTLEGVHRRAVRPMQLNRVEIALDRVIRAAVANFEPIAERSGIALNSELPDTLPRIFADEDRIIQVLTNLLDNAFKFTPRGGRITVRAREEGEQVWVQVADTGTGISPDELPLVFQQFYRGSESRPPEKRGMGLGLAICREIIIAHQGQIWAESEPGKGTRFTCTLPKG